MLAFIFFIRLFYFTTPLICRLIFEYLRFADTLSLLYAYYLACSSARCRRHYSADAALRHGITSHAAYANSSITHACAARHAIDIFSSFYYR